MKIILESLDANPEYQLEEKVLTPPPAVVPKTGGIDLAMLQNMFAKKPTVAVVKIGGLDSKDRG